MNATKIKQALDVTSIPRSVRSRWQALVKALLSKPVAGSQRGLSTVEELRELHATIDASTGGPLTKLPSRLLGLTFVRPGLVPTARWKEFEGIGWSDPTGRNDSLEPVWRIRAERTKLEMENSMNERATALGLPGDGPIIDAMLSHKPRRLSVAEMACDRATHLLPLGACGPASEILIGAARAA